jgi:hypothetical protein
MNTNLASAMALKSSSSISLLFESDVSRSTIEIGFERVARCGRERALELTAAAP